MIITRLCTRSVSWRRLTGETTTTTAATGRGLPGVGGGEEGDGRSAVAAVIERTSALRSAVAADGHGRGRGSLFVRTSEWTMNVAAWRYRVNFLEQQRRLEIISGSENP